MNHTRRRRFLVVTSALLAAPFARAQRPAKLIHIGILSQRFLRDRGGVWERFFFSGLVKRGWREGIEYAVEIKEARGDPARALALARELVASGVDLILALSTSAAAAAKQASVRIPIVTWCGYPVESGLATSLAKPGGNVTGVANYAGAEVWGKFVELVRELKPRMREIGVLWDYSPPAFPDGLVPLPAIEQAAAKMGVRTRIWMVRSEQDLIQALSEIERGPPEALIVTFSGGIHHAKPNIDRIYDLIVKRRLPAITDIAVSQASDMGAVLAYSPNVPATLERLADFIDRILRGASPGDLPFELPARFDLAVYAKTAKAINLTVPQSILLRADSVIE